MKRWLIIIGVVLAIVIVIAIAVRFYKAKQKQAEDSAGKTAQTNAEIANLQNQFTTEAGLNTWMNEVKPFENKLVAVNPATLQVINDDRLPFQVVVPQFNVLYLVKFDFDGKPYKRQLSMTAGNAVENLSFIQGAKFTNTRAIVRSKLTVINPTVFDKIPTGSPISLAEFLNFNS